MVQKLAIGFMAIGLQPYWDQFVGMKDKCTLHHTELRKKFDTNQYEIIDVGIVDSEALARDAGEAFKKRDVSIIFIQMLTYSVSAYIAPAVRELTVPVILLNIQFEKALDLSRVKTIGDWLSEGITCAGIPEATAVLARMKKQFDVITGHMKDDPRADREINNWCKAIGIKNRLAGENIGLFGRPYPGMMDFCIDETVVFSRFGTYVQHLDWQEIIDSGNEAGNAEIVAKLQLLNNMFEAEAAVTEKDLQYIAKIASGLEKIKEKYRLCAIAWHYEIEASLDHSDLVAALNPAMTMCITNGVGAAPEGDILSAIAMVILKTLAGNAAMAELYSLDFNNNTCLIGHSGACDAMISDKKANLKMSIFHGKKGKGYMTQFFPNHGPVTMLALTQETDGFKLVAAEGESVEGDVLRLGDTNLRVRFPMDIRDFVNTWSMEGPSHHGVIGTGLHINEIAIVAKALNIRLTVICKL